MIKIQPNKREWELLQRMVHEWEDRYFAFLRAYSAEASRVGLKRVKAKGPSDKEVGFEYKKRLKLANVEITQFEEPVSLWDSFKKKKHVKETVTRMDGRACAIVYDAKKELVRELDPQKTIIRVKTTIKKPSKAAVILTVNNPWTSDTLPWVPKESEAELIYEKVDEVVVTEVRNKKKRKIVRIVNDLKRAGVKGLSLKKQSSKVQDAKTISTVVQKVLQVEFGIGVRRRKHWREMIRFMKQKGDREVSKDARLLRVLGDPTYRAWKRLGVFKRKVKKDSADEFNSFQKKLSR